MAGNQPGDNQAPTPAARFEQADDFQALAQLQDEAEEAAFVIAGRYEVLSTLGQGGMGAVYKARDTRLGRIVAIKTILPQLLSQPQASRRFFREAEALARLDHPNILTLYDSGNDGAQHFLVMQLGGRDLVHILERQDGPLPLAPALHVALAVTRALEYAHQRGIIHRDLKPANILIGSPDDPASAPLTLSAAVKVMDFGLAKIEGASMLTAPQARLGTPQYMSPEQALGREADARADLYALGVLLYELAAGVRPFDGDDVQSILSQHLNLTPVPPSVFNDAIPATLEALILRLLEKDPAQRPTTAAEVAHMLEEIAAGLAPLAPSIGGKGLGERGPSLPTPAGERPQSGAGGALYRRVFAGRAAELRQLRAAFDAAAAGQGALALAVGEPGIGKTALCEQLAAYVAQRGGRALWGHSYEEGSLTLPYLPFVEALRSYVADRPLEALREEAGAAAPDLARLISAIGERLQVEPRPPGDPEAERWRLLEAVAGFLRTAAAAQPILLILEDLHWADRGALDLLVHLARNLTGARLLVVGTYRNVEVDRAHPLSKTLADLRRAANFTRIQLAGLSPADVGQVLEAIAGHDVPEGFVEVVQRQTEGNPLFVQEIVRYMAESGLIRREEGRWRRTGNAPLALEIPEGLRDVIGRRLSGLSAECNRVLAAAAVIGREFDLDTLTAVAGVSENVLEEALEEAIRVAVVEEQAGRGVAHYRFAHALFRQTLYEEIRGPRRLRLHGQVARALETRHHARLEEHAAELAEHFAQSTDPASLAKAVHYGEMAAHRALSVYAYAEAVRLWEQAIEVQEVLDPDDQSKRCDLLLALGEALVPAGEPDRAAAEMAEQAYVLAERMSDGRRAVQAGVLAVRASERFGRASVFTGENWRKWTWRLDRWAEPGTRERGWAAYALGGVAHGEGRASQVHDHWMAALETGERMGDFPLLYLAATYVLSLVTGPRYQAERWALAQRLLAQPLSASSSYDEARMFRFGAGLFMDRGEREQATRLARQAADFGERTQDHDLMLLWLVREIVLRFVDGDLHAAVALTHQMEEDYTAAGMTAAGRGFALTILLRPLGLLGRGEEWLARPQQMEWSSGLLPVVAARRVLSLAQVGRTTEALARLNEMLRGAVEREQEATPTVMLNYLLEAAVLLEEQAAAVRLAGWLAPMADRYESGSASTVGRSLGAAMALLGQPERARQYYAQGQAVAEKLRHRPELALIALGLAELEATEGNIAAARERLAFCIPEFEAMGMRPALEKAMGLRDSLEGE